MSTQKLGQLGETLARNYLEQHHLTVITTNYHSPFGEIDIIAKEGECFVFVEVKTRRRVTSHPVVFADAEKISGDVALLSILMSGSIAAGISASNATSTKIRGSSGRRSRVLTMKRVPPGARLRRLSNSCRGGSAVLVNVARRALSGFAA